MQLRTILIVVPVLVFLGTAMQAQEAITFKELEQLLDPYFAPELVGDVKLALPKAPFDVWGYDVGDYSGDGFNDLVVSIRRQDDKKNQMGIYFFIDEEGTLKLVQQTTVKFVELPIEVGVTVSQGNAYSMKKSQEFGWEMSGFRYKNGVMMLVDHFVTSRSQSYTREQYRNFQTLEGFERFLKLRDDQEVFRAEFLTVPCYSRGRDVSDGYQATALAELTKYVSSGAYYWKGPTDLSLEIRSAYDQEYLYFNIYAKDDEVIPMGTEGADSVADNMKIWVDTYAIADRIRAGGRSKNFRMKADTNIYGFAITLGDLVDQEPKVKVSSSNLMDDIQTKAATRIKAAAVRQDSGYAIKVRIPFQLLGFEHPPLDDSTLTELGVTVVVNDVDNPYRPNEVTTMFTSKDFDSGKPATFGWLVLVPPALHYGDSTNIYLGDVRARLEEIGF